MLSYIAKTSNRTKKDSKTTNDMSQIFNIKHSLFIHDSHYSSSPILDKPSSNLCNSDASQTVAQICLRIRSSQAPVEYPSDRERVVEYNSNNVLFEHIRERFGRNVEGEYFGAKCPSIRADETWPVDGSKYWNLTLASGYTHLPEA